MLISKNLLQKFVNISNIDATHIKETLTSHTAEVEDIKEISYKYLDKVVLGKILSIDPHPDPNITKVRVTKVHIGNNQILNIFCGATNIEVNMYVPVATIGTILANGVTLEKRELKGVISEGMICAKDEIGLSEMKEDGIWNLNDYDLTDRDLGVHIKKILELEEDIIFDIDNKTLSNRPDLFSHYGIARELATLLNTPLNEMIFKRIMEDKETLKIKVASINCYRYTAVKVSNIKVTKSPLWLQNKLTDLGIKPINNIVDITNYVMVSIGQPMHAFDVKKLDGGIIVRQAENGEKITLLNNKEYILDEHKMMIFNLKNIPIALAGIMGSSDSGINNNTTDLLLESACFDPYNIRKTSIDLCLRTDASTRYEKALDPELTMHGLQLAVQLILEICPDAKVQSFVSDTYKKKYPINRITISTEDIKKVIGIDFDPLFIEKTLLQLGFDLIAKKSKTPSWNIVVPSWRATRDISIKEDIAEEIARIFGFNKIPNIEPIVSLIPARVNKEREMIDEIKNILSYSFNEVFLYSFSWEKPIKDAGFDLNKCIVMKNSLTSKATTLIPSLFIPLIECAYRNIKNFNKFKIFEIDQVWTDNDQLLNREKNMLGGIISGYDENFYEAKSEIERLLHKLNISDFIISNDNNTPNQFHPKKFAKIIINDIQVGMIGIVHPIILKNFDITQDVCYFEIDIQSLFNIYKDKATIIKEISPYQTIYRDLNFIVDEDTKICDMYIKHENIISHDVLDIYRDDKIGTHKKSITFRYTINSYERTLTDKEINEIIDYIIAIMKIKNAELRNI